MSEVESLTITYENMLAVKDENGDTKLLPVISVTELFELDKHDQRAFYFSLLNTCQTDSVLRNSFSNGNVSTIQEKTEISREKIIAMQSKLPTSEGGYYDINKIMSSISEKNETIRMNFTGLGDADFYGTVKEGDILSLICTRSNLKKFPKRGELPVLINKEGKEGENISKNVEKFFKLETYGKFDLEFLKPDLFNDEEKITICKVEENEKGQEEHNLNGVGERILESLLSLLKKSGINVNNTQVKQSIMDFLIEADNNNKLMSLADPDFSSGDYIYYIKIWISDKLSEILENYSDLPKEVIDTKNWGHIHFFQLIIYVCLLPYLKEKSETRETIINRVLQITRNFAKNNLPKDYLNDNPVDFIIKKICGQEVSAEFIEEKKKLIKIFHGCMFSKEVQAQTYPYHVTQFNFLFLDLAERTYNDGFFMKNKFVVPLLKLFKTYEIEADNLPELISDGNQLISDEFEYFKFPATIGELNTTDQLNKLTPKQVIRFIYYLTNWQIGMFRPDNTIKVFECVCDPQNGYLDSIKQKVFNRFFVNQQNRDTLLSQLSMEQIVNWQNYISPNIFKQYLANLFRCLDSEEIMPKWVNCINENKLSEAYEKGFIEVAINRKRVDIFKGFLPEKIINYLNGSIFILQDSFNYYKDGQEKNLFDEEDFLRKLFEYVEEHLSDNNVKKFIVKKPISELFFENHYYPIKDLYNLFYTDNDGNFFEDKFFPWKRANELINFMEEGNILENISQRLKIYTSQSYLFEEFVSYIFAKGKNDEQFFNNAINIVINEMNARTRMILWLSPAQYLLFMEFCSYNMQKENVCSFVRNTEIYLINNVRLNDSQENILNSLSKDLLSFLPYIVECLSPKQIWEFREKLNFKTCSTNKWLECAKYVFDNKKDINSLKKILQESPVRIDTISSNFKNARGKTGKENVFKYFFELMLDAEGNVDENFIFSMSTRTIWQQAMNDFNDIFFVLESIYGINNIPENYKTVLTYFINYFSFASTASILPFLEFYHNFTKYDEDKFVRELKKLKNQWPAAIEYFLYYDENERLDFKNEFFQYNEKRTTESENTRLFVEDCRKKMQKNNIIIPLRSLTLRRIVKSNEMISIDSFTDPLNRFVLFNLVDYILENGLEITGSFLKKIIYGLIDTEYTSLEGIGYRTMRRLFHACNGSKDEKISCLCLKYDRLLYNYARSNFIKKCFEPSLMFDDISLSDFFKEKPGAKKIYFEEVFYSEDRISGKKLAVGTSFVALSVIMFTVFALGFVSLGVGLGVGIPAAVIGLPLVIYSLVSIIKNGIKKWRINHASFNYPQTEINIENPDQHLQPEVLAEVPAEEPAEEPAEVPAEEPAEVPAETLE